MRLSSILVWCCLLGLTGCTSCDDDTYYLNDTGVRDTEGQQQRFGCSGDYIYVLERHRLNWYDYSTSGDLTVAGTMELYGGGDHLTVVGRRLFVGSTMQVYGFTLDSLSGEPVLRWSIPQGQGCDPISVTDSLVYVISRLSDCRQADSPTLNEVSTFVLNDTLGIDLIHSFTQENPRGIAIQNSLMVLCEGTLGFSLFDVSDPTLPLLLAKVEAITADRVIVQDDLLVIVGPQFITQFDISDPTLPILLGTLELGV